MQGPPPGVPADVESGCSLGMATCSPGTVVLPALHLAPTAKRLGVLWGLVFYDLALVQAKTVPHV